jgi:hypothetical protein
MRRAVSARRGRVVSPPGQFVRRLAKGDPENWGGEPMKALFWIGMVVLILGIVSLVVPIPRNERKGFQAGGLSIGVETQYEEKVSPFVSAVMILGGVGAMVAGKMRS